MAALVETRIGFWTISCLRLNSEDAIKATRRHGKWQKGLVWVVCFFVLLGFAVLGLVDSFWYVGLLTMEELEGKGNRVYCSQTSIVNRSKNQCLVPLSPFDVREWWTAVTIVRGPGTTFSNILRTVL